MLKAVLIDVDNTLLDFNKCARISMTTALKEHNIDFQEPIFDVFHEINNNLWREIEKGSITKSDLYKIRWNMIFEKVKIPLDGEIFEKRFVNLLQECAEPVYYAKELLQYLSRKYLIFAASNAPHQQQIVRLKKAGMLEYINDVFTSEKMGFSKPRKEFFDGCFMHMRNLLPHQVIMIGDSLTADIGAGISYGLKTCWFNYEKERIPEEIKPDYIVDTLDKIIELL